MTDSGLSSGPLTAADALALARERLAEPESRRRSNAGALGAAALAAVGGLAATWIVVLGPSLEEPASAEPVRTPIAASASGLGAS